MRDTLLRQEIEDVEEGGEGKNVVREVEVKGKLERAEEKKKGAR